MVTTAQRLRAIDKKARRQMAHRARKEGVAIEGVITATTGTLRDVAQRSVNVTQLYNAAQRDMGKRMMLTERWHDGNVDAGKARRKLNDWELATGPAGPSAAWQPKSTRRAVGKCDVDVVNKRNRLSAAIELRTPNSTRRRIT